MSVAVHPDAPPSAFGAVVLAASLGGLRAVSAVLERLPAAFPTPVVVVQHGAGRNYVHILASSTELPVRSAEPGTGIPTSGVTVLPAGVGVTAVAGEVRFEKQPTDLRPADDVLATLAAVSSPLISVVLSGKLDDGARGSRVVKRAGGRVLVQDPATAAASGMPNASLATGCVDFVLSLERIAIALVALTMAPGAAELFTVPMPPWADYGSDRP